MKVKALKNIIYDGTFHKAGDVFSMTNENAASYAQRHWVVMPKNSGTATELPASLPPLTVDGKKKK